MSGCADSVLFVTKTSIGLDFDTKPPAASIAYDRVEGYIGPRYDNGAVPPVYGRILSDKAIFNTKVRQIYATGAAAQRVLHTPQECAQNPKTCAPASTELVGGKRLMFFGTTTATGLKVTFSPEYQYPDSFHLGYKRKEFSFIPLGEFVKPDGAKEDRYPSVLAAIDTEATASGGVSAPSAGLLTSQFFATGATADQLAQEDYIRNLFEDEAADAFRVYRSVYGAQEVEATRILRCYLGVTIAKRPEAWADANAQGLFRQPIQLQEMTALRDAALADPALREAKLREADRMYASDIAILEGTQPARLQGLKQHRKKVCELARS
jgi:hypothetical protein